MEKKKITLVATQSLAGKYKLPYDRDQSFEIEDNLGAEMVATGFALPADKDGNAVDKKSKAAILIALKGKAAGFGIEVPENATAAGIEKLIDESHFNALEELKKIKGATVVTNDPEKEAAAAATKQQPKAENTSGKAPETAEKA
jgi:hypothetical protein